MKTIVDYAEKVKAQHALNKTLAPIETDLTDASQAYAIGDQFIYDGVLYKAKTAIAQHDALVLNTNYEDADDITTQIKNKTVTTDPVPTEGSTNPVQSNGVYVDNRNIYEVMGQNGAKNKEPFDIDVVKALNTTGTWTGNSYELNGITFAFADDGKVTVSGTASALCSITISGNYDLNGGYIITGCPSGGGGSTYSLRIYDSSTTLVADDVGEGVSFTANNLTNCRTNLIVRKDAAISTPIVFAPMIRDSKDTDPTYQPYAKTNQQLTAENEALTNKLNNEIVTRSALGAKNILPFDLAEIKALNTNGTWAGNVYTYRGVAFTVNSDGTISATGTATGGNASIKLFAASSNYEMLGKEVILAGCPSNGSESTYRIQAYRMASADGSTGTYFDDGAGTDAFTVLNDASGTVGSFAVAVYENATVTNLLFKPMVRLASDPDATYQPYAKTNRELTAENQTLTNYANAQSNPNLLDNPFFTVNQRGEDSYSASTSYTYTIDRWLLYNATLSKITKGVRYTAVNNSLCVLRQFIENVDYLDGEKVTLSAIINNELRVLSGTFFKNNTNLSQAFVLNNGSFALQLIMGSNDTYARVVLASYTTENLDIKAFKLELGEVSTLAIDTAPNYSLELLKCQRYFVRYLMPDNSGAPLGIGFYSSTTNARLSLTLPIEMRAKPSVNISDISKFKVIVDSVAKVTSAVTVSGVFQNIITLNFTTDNATQYAIATLNRTTQGEYIDLSADL